MSGGGGSGAPSGRSPYPTRTSRFSMGSEVGSGGGGVGGGGEPSTTANTTGAHSPFLNNLLRFSPKNSQPHHLSPLQRGSVTNAGQRRARFFDSGRGGGHPFHQQQQQLSQQANNNNTSIATGNASLNTTADDDVMDDPSVLDHSKTTGSTIGTIVDGIPVDHLRNLAQNSLLQSPTTAVYYSDIVLAKTGRVSDALLLARAHIQAAQYEAGLRILDEASLLHASSSADQHCLRWEAVLLACQALHAKKDWNPLVEVLEDICRLPDLTQTNINASTSNNPTMPSFHALAVSQYIEDDDEIGWLSLKRAISASFSGNNSNSIPTSIHPLALICWYRGLAYHETDSGMRAATYWKLALRIDCQCQAAWEALLDKNLLTPAQAHDWVQHQVDFAPHQEWLRALYLARIELTPQEPMDAATSSSPDAANLMASLDASSIQLSSPLPTFHTPGNALLQSKATATAPAASTQLPLDPMLATGRKSEPSPIQQDVDTAFHQLWNKYKLQDSSQVLAMAARRAYRRYDWKSTLAYCQELSQLDPAVEEVVYCYVATLVLLGHKRVLFRLAHEWVEASPKAAHAWFAVGAYYYCIQRYHVAQRHFCRATRLNPQCTPAWIAFGCSFAACDESDQALASFRAAQRLSPGEHTSLLYMGMEYARTNHLVLAQYFLQAAAKASGGDPLCLHELGVLAAQKDEHADAIAWFRRALAAVVSTCKEATTAAAAAAAAPLSLQECIDQCHDAYWEPTIFNLGHSYRKTRQFDAAAKCFARCVALCPDRFSTYAALAFTEHLQGALDPAIAHYHQALGLKPDDPFSTDLLSRALSEQTLQRPQPILMSTETSAPIVASSATQKRQGTAAAAALKTKSMFLSPVSAASREDSAMMVDSDDDMSRTS